MGLVLPQPYDEINVGVDDAPIESLVLGACEASKAPWCAGLSAPCVT